MICILAIFFICYRKRKSAKIMAFMFWTASFLGYGYMVVYRVYYWSQTKYYILIYHIAMSFMYMIVSVIGGFEKVLAASSRWYKMIQYICVLKKCRIYLHVF